LLFLGLKKSGRFVIFLVPFWRILSEKWLIGIYRKTGPTKSTVLGPGPPPGAGVEIFRNLWLFVDCGVFNTAGKSVSKIGTYALPPLKSDFYSHFINSRPNFGNCLLFVFGPWHNFFTLPFFGPGYCFTLGKNPTVFLNIWYNDVLLMGILVVDNLSRHCSRHQTNKSPSNKGLSRRRQ
jgi:hypothetical protein